VSEPPAAVLEVTTDPGVMLDSVMSVPVDCKRKPPPKPELWIPAHVGEADVLRSWLMVMVHAPAPVLSTTPTRTMSKRGGPRAAPHWPWLG